MINSSSDKCWTYLSPLHKWQNLKAITSLVKVLFSLSCSSDCSGQPLLPPSASHSSSSRHSYTCPARSPSTPMHTSQPCWHSKKNRLNRGWSQKATAQTPPNGAVLSRLALGQKARPFAQTPSWKAAVASEPLTRERQEMYMAAVESRVQEHGLCIVSETNTGDSCFRRHFESFDFAAMLQQLWYPVCSAWQQLYSPQSLGCT